MFIHTKILSVEEDDVERSEDLGIPLEPHWLPFSFKVEDLRLFYEHIEDGVPKGTVIMLNDFSDYTTQLDYDDLAMKVEHHFEQARWIFKNN